jgi:hypothetical protein
MQHAIMQVMVNQDKEEIEQALAAKIQLRQAVLGQVISRRLLETYPEINDSLRLEERYSPIERLAAVSVTRLSELVRAALIFGQPTLIDDELRWAIGYLPKQGVKFDHQDALVRWMFEEIRQMHLSNAEYNLSIELEQYIRERIKHLYRRI